MLRTPIILIIFRRPELTRRVVEAIARVDPSKLIVVADGPRENHPGEDKLCAETRAVIDHITWKGEVIKLYSDVNLGCGKRPATGISSAFEEVEEAIILEDDCLPDPSFFRFCEEMLERYRTDERVMQVQGCTYGRNPGVLSESYHFSHFPGCWGWATWRRAWKRYDYLLEKWADLRGTSWLKDIVQNEDAVRYWSHQFDLAYDRRGDVSFWDYQWAFAVWECGGVSVVPRQNLIANIGCGPDATHTFDKDDPTANLPLHSIQFPLCHPTQVQRNAQLDREFLLKSILPSVRRKPQPAIRRMATKLYWSVPEFVRDGYRKVAVPFRRYIGKSRPVARSLREQQKS